MLRNLEIIKRDLRKEFEDVKGVELEDMFSKIKNIFMENVNYTEMMNMEQFIITDEGGFICFYRNGELHVNYTPIAMVVNEKYKTKKSKEVTKTMLDWFEEKGVELRQELWSIAKFKNEEVALHIKGTMKLENGHDLCATEVIKIKKDNCIDIAS